MENQLSIKKGSRLISLDAFRGYTIAAMIIVNTPGSWQHVYEPLLHANWNGATPTDLVFPFFLFIVGVSIALAFTKRLEKGSTRKDLFKKSVIRSIKIFALGIFLSLFPEFDFGNLRIPGVLQRIAIVYLACSFIFLKTDWRKQAWIGGILLITYWLMMTLIPVPGIGHANLEPGTNLAAWLDSQLIPGRMWQGTWDPEGILSTIPSIVTGITGMLIGILILSQKDISQKIIWMFFLGFISYLLGIFWGWFFPINKNLWTSSYVLYSSGLGTMALAAFIWFIDVLGYKKTAKFGIIYGSNAITIYVLAGMLPSFLGSLRVMYFTGLTDYGMDPRLVSLIWAILICLICFIPALILYKKKIFIKV